MQIQTSVSKPSKQRKMLHTAADHRRHRLFAMHLSAELRTSHLVKSFPVRSGDTIRIMRGDHKGFEGKVTRIDKKRYRIYVEGLTREKADGTTIFVPIHPSKAMITHLNLDDKWRKKTLERKKSSRTKTKEARLEPKTKAKERLKTEPEGITEIKPAVEEKTVETTVSEKETVPIVKPAAKMRQSMKEKRLEEAKPSKKPTRTKKRTVKKTSAHQVETVTPKPEEKRKPETKKRKTKRTVAKKNEGGE